ncbi:MAG: LCP family protein [Clostridia bacterium]|nr:LCP family protein [Clostridia bacterium]
MSRIIKLALLAIAVYFCVLLVTTGTVGDIFNSLLPGGAPLGYVNVLLLGVDDASASTQRTDTMIIATITNAGDIRLTSIMRDMLVSVEGHGARKINSAYAYGGADLAVKTVNDNFDMNISRWAVVDFSDFAALIDEIGGVRLAITRAEMDEMNKKNGHQLATYGEDVLLDGVQALRYVRIRKIDSDYQRTNRQRRLLTSVFNSIREIKDPIRLISIANSARKYVSTNVPTVSIAINAIRALAGTGQISQLRIPAEGTYESGMLDGVWSIRADLAQNAKIMKEFIYG